MEPNNKPKKKIWPLILLVIAIIGAIGSHIECSIAVPKCGGFCWNSTSRWNNKRNRYCKYK